jgi:hypothetical protein
MIKKAILLLTFLIVTTISCLFAYDVTITSNIPGVTIYEDSLSVGVAPQTFTNITGSHLWGVMNISTLVKPLDKVIMNDCSVAMDYCYPTLTDQYVIGGPGCSIIVPDSGFVNIPALNDVIASGLIKAPGLLVFTEIFPEIELPTELSSYIASVYHNYSNYSREFQVWVSNTDMLNNGSLSFKYAPATPNAVAIHWGGDDNGYWPVNHPDSVSHLLNGYVFNGGIPDPEPNNFVLGMAPFTESSYIDSVLTIGPIPPFEDKGPGVFEAILNVEPVPEYLWPELSAVTTAQGYVDIDCCIFDVTTSVSFNIFRNTNTNDIVNAVKLNSEPVPYLTSDNCHLYHYTDMTTTLGNYYYYWIQLVAQDGTSSFYGPVLAMLEIQPPPPTPPISKLHNAHPNPFHTNTYTDIIVEVKDGEKANLSIYNIRGQLLQTYTCHVGSNNIRWDGKDSYGNQCGSGIYFYKMTSPTVHAIKKMMLIK